MINVFDVAREAIAGFVSSLVNLWTGFFQMRYINIFELVGLNTPSWWPFPPEMTVFQTIFGGGLTALAVVLVVKFVWDIFT